MDIGQLPHAEGYNVWLEYNDPGAPLATDNGIRAHYRRHPYAPVARPNLRPGIFQGQARIFIPPPIINQQEEDQRLQVFLDETGRIPADLAN
ncbi:hypothetical protein IFR05_010261 [Cadophora sp. M221]|nr:hypothetical protein IFR05_010261 [Cadophora sp. M221]